MFQKILMPGKFKVMKKLRLPLPGKAEKAMLMFSELLQMQNRVKKFLTKTKSLTSKEKKILYGILLMK